MDFIDLAKSARKAAVLLATVSRQEKDFALVNMAKALRFRVDEILAANQLDLQAGQDAGFSQSLLDRLALSPARIEAMAKGLEDLAGLADPVGDVARGWVTAQGLEIRQVRVPFGVVGIIYEARPNVTADAAGICLKSGNAALLRGSSSALNSNKAIIGVLQSGLQATKIPPAAIQMVSGGRAVTEEMMAARGWLDVLIPRGGAGLIEAVVQGAKVPVIETGTGNCHLYVDAAANQEMALAILLNAKVQRPSVCNACETLLVHQDIAAEFLPKAAKALVANRVRLHADSQSLEVIGAVVDSEFLYSASASDFDTEYLGLDIAVAVVPDIAAAISHIRQYSTGHSETIITEDLGAAQRFTAEVDAAAVLVNASSRFVDGGEFGFGAEIGISTQKLHARGPMALPEMTTTKFVVYGQGQIRE